MKPVNAAIIYYSCTGTVHALARAAADGADKAGAHVRLRKVAELAPPGRRRHRTPVATGRLANKVYSAFTSTGTAHGGHESTLLALGNVFYHWGGIIVPRLHRPIQ